VLQSLGELYALGWEVDWASLYRDSRRDFVTLPSYPWEHRRYWIEPGTSATEAAPARIRSLSPSELRPEPETDEDDEARRERVSLFYDRLATSMDPSGKETFLTFAPFLEPVPNFSWLLAFYAPGTQEQHWPRIVAAQKQMREVLFRGIDLSAVHKVLDFGCGYGSDLIRLAEQYPHLELTGYTVSPMQAEIGNKKIVQNDLQDRVSLYVRDSSRDEFPGCYDVIFGFEVAPYIKDKHQLFSNIDRHLQNGGFLLLADFVANTISEIAHDETSSFIITREQWIGLLSSYKLLVVRCVDVSREIANFLYDPDADEHLLELRKGTGDPTHIPMHFASYDNLGKMLDRRLVNYNLLTIRKDRFLAKDEIARINRQHLSAPKSYAEAVRTDESALEVLEGGPRPGEEFSEWLYEVQWCVAKRQEVAAEYAASEEGSWLILADTDGVGEAVAELLPRGQRSSGRC